MRSMEHASAHVSTQLAIEDESWLRDFLLRTREQIPETFLLEELYGFLHAVVCAPDLVAPSEWVPVIFGDEEPRFESEAEAERFYQSAMTLYNELNHHAHQGAVHLPSCIELRSPPVANLEEGAPLQRWSSGFAQGYDWLDLSWDVELPQEIDEELGACMAALMFFSSREFAEALCRDFKREPADIPQLAEVMLESFEGAMTGFATIGRLVEEIKHKQAGSTRVPRSAPCPCGSGKEYGNCCGAAA